MLPKLDIRIKVIVYYQNGESKIQIKTMALNWAIF